MPPVPPQTQQQTVESTATVVDTRAAVNGAALAKAEKAPISGTYHSPAEIDSKLAAAASRFHLVSPFTACGAIPEGFAVRLAAVKVDVKTETYPIPGGPKRGLSKVVLDKIGHALGISWDPRLSGRLDDGKEPRYCRYRVIGSYMGPDGIRHFLQGEKEVDLREGSPTVEGLEGRAKDKGKTSEREVRELRMHIVSHAETKARLRAIRSMGIRTSYDEDELAKPFFAAQVVVTGHSEDPVVRREFSRMLMANALAGTAQLYGPPPAAALEEPPRLPAPPVGGADVDDDDEEIDPETGEVRARDERCW